MTKPNISEVKVTEKKSVIKEEIEAFVKSNIAPLERKEVDGEEVLTNSACIDGRTEEKDSKGRVRIIGGDAGLLFSFAATLNELGIQKENEELVSSLIDAKKEVSGEDARLNLHTDEHGEKDGTIGCGHANRMSSKKEEFNGDGKYGLTWDSAKDIFEEAYKRSEAEHTVLQGDHGEVAAVFVHGGEKGQRANFSINSLDSESGMSVFVVDVEATDEYFETYIPRMAELLGVDVPTMVVLNNYYKQLNISAGLLAGHLEKYDAYIESAEKFRVEEAS